MKTKLEIITPITDNDVDGIILDDYQNDEGDYWYPVLPGEVTA